LSSEAVFKALDIELLEIEEWSCCGASSAHSLNHQLSLSLPGRNLVLADDTGLDMMIPCPACYLNTAAADRALRDDAAWRARMEAELDCQYSGNGRPRHPLDVLVNDIGITAVRDRVERPLTGLKVVCHYGCVLVRPPELTGWDDAEHPTSMDKLLEALGAEVLDWSYKVDCCGASLTLSLSDVVVELSNRLIGGAIEAGADCITSPCGICQINLDTRQVPHPSLARAGNGGRQAKMPIFYFTELMGLAFGLPDTKKWLGMHTVDPLPLLRGRGLLS
jgi:heterodisulfide reductase subunit B